MALDRATDPLVLLADTLWLERRLLEYLLFKLVAANLILTADAAPFVPLAIDEVEQVMGRVRESEAHRRRVVAGRAMAVRAELRAREQHARNAAESAVWADAADAVLHPVAADLAGGLPAMTYSDLPARSLEEAALMAQDPPAAGNALHFPDGIPGFPQLERFVLVAEVEGGAFQRLQSLDVPQVSMYVCVPWLFFPDYAPELGPAEQEDLDIERPEDALVFCPVTIDLETRSVYLNLLGPFVVNAETRRGRQLVLAGSDYPVRAHVQLGP